jgi:hypothetical protein
VVRILKWALGILLEIPLSTQQGTQQALKTPQLPLITLIGKLQNQQHTHRAFASGANALMFALTRPCRTLPPGKLFQSDARPRLWEHACRKLVEVPTCSAGERQHERNPVPSSCPKSQVCWLCAVQSASTGTWD